MQEESLAAWLSLSLVPGLSSRQLHAYLQDRASPLELIHDVSAAAGNAGGSEELRKIRAACQAKVTRDKVKQALRWQEQKGCQIITLACASYPVLLREIADPPPVLYIRGNPRLLQQPQIALVGSRKPSPGGREMARMLAAELAGGGYVITSGLAIGIDAESHLGALEVNGDSIAVLGCGVDQLYPRANHALAESLIEKGALVSEFPLNSPPEAWHFPQRNRIISGLSQAVVVIEAAQKSGSLITAYSALEQNRDVFAVPGSPFNPMARGCNKLIKSGAGLVEEAGDIVAELKTFTDSDTKREPLDLSEPVSLSRDAGCLLQHLDGNPASVDKLQQRSGLATQSLMASLVELEIEGLIEAGPGGYSLSPSGA